MIRELEEELNLPPGEVVDVVCTGLVSDRSLRQPELIFSTTTSRTRRQIEAGVDPDEHNSAVAIPADERHVERAIADPLITPVGVAALVLWGRGAFGEAWLERLD